jgi:sulfur carrier protein
LLGSEKVLVTINGVESEVPDGLSIEELIAAKSMLAGTLVIELNGEIVKQEQWKTTGVHSGDNMEVVRIIGGG